MRYAYRLIIGTVLAGVLAFGSAGVATAEPLAPTASQPVPTAVAIPPSCGVNDNLALTADQFLGKCVRGSVRGEFPTPLLGATVQNIRDNRSLNADYKKAWKFISQTRFRK